MERQRVLIDDIHTNGRERRVDEAKVLEIAASISRIGVLNPPAVRMVAEMEIGGELIHNVPVLVHGHHRLRAMKSLGEEVIECVILDADDDHAKLMEVDENLARAELGPAEERRHLLLHEELVAKIKAREEENSGGKSFPTRSTDKLRTTGPQHHKQFAAELAELTGDSKRIINKKLAEARVLRDDLSLINGTCLDKGVEIEALAAMSAEERAPLIAQAISGDKVTARPSEKPSTDQGASAAAALNVLSGCLEPPPKDKTIGRMARQRQKFWKLWASMDQELQEEIFKQMATLMKVA